jgi:hypothetical protein
VIAACADFAPAADEVWRLQRDEDPECRWFRQAVRGAPDPVAGSMQGTYVLTPDGALLGRLNSTDPDRVLAMLTRALEAWRALPDVGRAPSSAPGLVPRHRWEDSYPADGLALERFARDVGSAPSEPPARPVNRDTVWFDQRELSGFVPHRGEVGAARDVDAALIERLARFAFVDNVRGQTLPFSRAALRETRLRSEVSAIEDGVWSLRLWGETVAQTAGDEPGQGYWRSKRPWPRSLRARVAGEAKWDPAAGRFVQFDLVAVGTRRGRTTFNGRGREEVDSEHGIGFLLRIAPTGDRVAPTFVNLYDVPWVKTP